MGVISIMRVVNVMHVVNIMHVCISVVNIMDVGIITNRSFTSCISLDTEKSILQLTFCRNMTFDLCSNYPLCGLFILIG